MARAIQRPAARRDFIIHYMYLAEKASLETAKRFREAVEAAYEELAGMPGIGSPGKVLQGKYANVRLWRVRGFENYLIAYRAPCWGGNRAALPCQTGLSPRSALTGWLKVAEPTGNPGLAV